MMFTEMLKDLKWKVIGHSSLVDEYCKHTCLFTKISVINVMRYKGLSVKCLNYHGMLLFLCQSYF